MTAYLAKRVAARLNRLKVPGCEMESPLGQVLLAWTNRGGRLVVLKGRKGGLWVAYRQAVLFVPDEVKRQK